MTIEQLIASLIAYLKLHHGSFYTSTKLRDNPNVCHACCIWFLNNVQRNGLMSTIALLDTLDKSTFQVAQSHALKGPSMPSLMLKQAIGSSHATNRRDLEAIEHMLDYHAQPNAYIGDITTFTANLIVACRAGGQDRVIIYMLGSGDTGHVICLCRNVGGIVIYDPNMGVMTARFSDADTWGEIIRRILRWYAEHMGLNRFGFKPQR